MGILMAGMSHMVTAMVKMIMVIRIMEDTHTIKVITMDIHMAVLTHK